MSADTVIRHRYTDTETPHTPHDTPASLFGWSPGDYAGEQRNPYAVVADQDHDVYELEVAEDGTWTFTYRTETDSGEEVGQQVSGELSPALVQHLADRITASDEFAPEPSVYEQVLPEGLATEITEQYQESLDRLEDVYDDVTEEGYTVDDEDLKPLEDLPPTIPSTWEEDYERYKEIGERYRGDLESYIHGDLFATGTLTVSTEGDEQTETVDFLPAVRPLNETDQQPETDAEQALATLYQAVGGELVSRNLAGNFA